MMIERLGGLLAGDVIGSVHEGQPAQPKGLFRLSAQNHLTDDSLVAITAMNLVDRLSEQWSPQAFGERWPTALRSAIVQNPDTRFSPDMRLWANGLSHGGFMEGNGVGVLACALALSSPGDEDGCQLALRSAGRQTHSEEAVYIAGLLIDWIYQLRRQSQARQLPSLASGDVYHPMLSRFDPTEFRQAPMDMTLWSTLPAAVWSFLQASTFTELYENILHLGGDTDSIGAMAGALGHARWGYQKLPDTIVRMTQEALYEASFSCGS